MCSAPTLFLTQSVLSKLVCSECKGHLSSGPVKVRLDGGSVCGKCITSRKHSIALIDHEAFDEIVSLIAFPCKYQRMGCMENIRFDDIVVHEEQCGFKEHLCPADFLLCSWSGTYVQVSQHFREKHPEMLLEKASFELDVSRNSDLVRLFVADGLQFLINTKISPSDDKIWFNVVFVGQRKKNDLIKYKIILHTGQVHELQMILRERTCGVFDAKTALNGDYGQSVEIKSLISLLDNPENVICNVCFCVPEKIASERDEEIYKVLCPNCKIFMSPPIYQCEFGHVTCFDCTGYKSICLRCKKTKATFARVLDLETISATNQLPCRWKNCGRFLNCHEIREHERTCPHKRFKCPRCVSWYGLKDELEEHVYEEHTRSALHVSNEVIFDGDVGEKDLIVVAHGEVFTCAVSSSEDNSKNVCVKYCGPPSAYNSFEYLVELRHSKIPHFAWNQTYRMESSRPCDYCYSFKLKIPENDVEKFNVDSDYQIIVEIIKL